MAYFGVAYSAPFQHVHGANKTGVPKIRRMLFPLRLTFYVFFKSMGNNKNSSRSLLFSLHFSIVIFHFAEQEAFKELNQAVTGHLSLYSYFVPLNILTKIHHK